MEDNTGATRAGTRCLPPESNQLPTQDYGALPHDPTPSSDHISQIPSNVNIPPAYVPQTVPYSVPLAPHQHTALTYLSIPWYLIAPQIPSPAPVTYENAAKPNILAGYDTSQRQGLLLRQIDLWYDLATGDADKSIYLQNVTNKAYEYQQEIRTHGYVANPQYSAHNTIFLPS